MFVKHLKNLSVFWKFQIECYRFKHKSYLKALPVNSNDLWKESKKVHNHYFLYFAIGMMICKSHFFPHFSNVNGRFDKKKTRKTYFTVRCVDKIYGMWSILEIVCSIETFWFRIYAISRVKGSEFLDWIYVNIWATSRSFLPLVASLIRLAICIHERFQG